MVPRRIVSSTQGSACAGEKKNQSLDIVCVWPLPNVHAMMP